MVVDFAHAAMRRSLSAAPASEPRQRTDRVVSLLDLPGTLLAVNASTRAADHVVPNDHRAPAGTLRAGTLVLRLEVRTADWHPDGDSAPGAPMLAFAE